MIGGLVVAWYCYLINPKVPAAIRKGLSGINTLLDNKYYADWFNEQVLARGARLLGRGLWQGGDRGVIDGIINGSARFVDWTASVGRLVQSGFIYHYAFAMIIGRSEEHTSELQSLMRISYAVFWLKKKNNTICNRDENYKNSQY